METSLQEKIPVKPLTNGKFKFTPLGLNISESVTIQDWLEVGETLKAIERGIQFALGDWLAWGELTYGEMASQGLDDIDYGLLRSYKWVSGAIPMSLRKDTITWSHHKEIAGVAPELREHYLYLAESDNLTVRALRKKINEDKKKSTIVISNPPENQIYQGDISILSSKIPNNSIDLFFTDPPYHEHSTDTFFELGKLASEKLKPGGLCLAYSGQMHLPQAMIGISTFLSYWWLFAIRHNQGHLTIWNRNLWNDWKPVLVYAKPYDDGSLPLAPDWVQDFNEGGGRDKRYHEWGQDASEATYWIEKLTEKDALICDPFVGGGAIPVACKLTNRRWIGCDVDEKAVLTARQRLEDIS